jgi:hypothetical protein
MKFARRSPLFKAACLLILAFMFAPAAIMAAPSVSGATPVLGSIGGFNPMLLGALGAGGATLVLRQSADDAGSENGGGDGDPSAANEDNPKLSVMQRLTAAMQSKTALLAKISGLEAKITEHEQTIATHAQSVADLQAKLDAANAKVSKLEADAAEVEKALNAAESEAKELRAKETDLSKRASQQAKEIAQSVGIRADQLPPSAPESSVSGSAVEDALKAFQKERDPEKKAELHQAWKNTVAKEAAAKSGKTA